MLDSTIVNKSKSFCFKVTCNRWRRRFEEEKNHHQIINGSFCGSPSLWWRLPPERWKCLKSHARWLDHYANATKHPPLPLSSMPWFLHSHPLHPSTINILNSLVYVYNDNRMCRYTIWFFTSSILYSVYHCH